MSDTPTPYKTGSAADALDGIRAGASQVVIITHSKLNETRDALNGGNFVEAMQALNAALVQVSQLAAAQTAMGMLAENRLVRVGDVEEGMVVRGVGSVTDIGPCPGCGDEGCNNLAITVGDLAVVLDRDVELVIEAA